MYYIFMIHCIINLFISLSFVLLLSYILLYSMYLFLLTIIIVHFKQHKLLLFLGIIYFSIFFLPASLKGKEWHSCLKTINQNNLIGALIKILIKIQLSL